MKNRSNSLPQTTKKFGFTRDVATLESVVKAEFKGKKVHMTYMNKAERNVSVVLDNPCVK